MPTRLRALVAVMVAESTTDGTQLAHADRGQKKDDEVEVARVGVCIVTELWIGTTTQVEVGRYDEIESSDAAGSRVNWSLPLRCSVLLCLALTVAVAAGVLRWKDWSMRDAELARLESESTARDSTIGRLTFGSNTIGNDAATAQQRLTGGFRYGYPKLFHAMLSLEARKNHVTTIAGVPMTASATNRHATLVLVDETVTVGSSPPSDRAVSLRGVLGKFDGRWLVSRFDQVSRNA